MRSGDGRFKEYQLLQEIIAHNCISALETYRENQKMQGSIMLKYIASVKSSKMTFMSSVEQYCTAFSGASEASIVV